LVLGSARPGAWVLGFGWSRLVDRPFAETVASALFGYTAPATPITNTLMGAIFAFVSGLTGTFTACNVAGFSALAPLASHRRSIGICSSSRPRPTTRVRRRRLCPSNPGHHHAAAHPFPAPHTSFL